MNKKITWTYDYSQGTGNVVDDVTLAKTAMNKRGYMGSPFQGIIGLIWQDSPHELNLFDAELANFGFVR